MTLTTDERKNLGGRPEKDIDWELVDKLILRQNSGAEIAGHFNMHPETFYCRVQDKWGVGFTGYAGTIYSKGHSTLRSRQWDKAMEGNVQMLIRLGELYLDDQKPKTKEDNEVTKVVFDVNYGNNNQVEILPKALPTPDPASPG
ncbi:MAG: hypothetical protein A3F13_02725 [Gammaproteobacteria bacterium RIFCSPHIGHO2_12_FULL_40_19]|nr:MAG: hypothetical protein A3F13_02725 [Gammaproteobacteria bacterium RIFCSPHIGHO2_12_FULL_40_19]